MPKDLIFGRVIPMFDGRCPWIWLSPTPNISNEDRLKIEGGIVLDNLFPHQNIKVWSIGQKNQG